jgi:hypothetical protein
LCSQAKYVSATAGLSLRIKRPLRQWNSPEFYTASKTLSGRREGKYRKIETVRRDTRYHNEITNVSEGDFQARRKENYLIFGQDDLRQSAAPAGGPSVMGF